MIILRRDGKRGGGKHAGWGISYCNLLSADHLVAVVSLRQHPERRFDDSSAQAQHEMKGRLCKNNPH